MPNLRIAVVMFGVLSGCGARMVETHGASPYGPKNEQPGGRVQYISTGLAALVQSRREDAYKQMYEACAGSYNITREFDEQGSSYTSGNTQYNRNSVYGSSVTTTSMIRVIEFACVPANAPAPAPAPAQ